MERHSEARLDAEFRRGLRELAGHRPDLAVRSLRAAVDSCPVAQPRRLSRNLYWLGLALFRLDQAELGVRSLASAQKLRPRGIARSAYLLRINEYGMCKQPSPDLDDFHAFYSVQAGFYLGHKKSGRFDSNPEKDMVTRLIRDAWRTLSCSGELEGLGASSKLAAFKARTIAFPLVGLGNSDTGKVIEGDFRRGGKVGDGRRCVCGSGLPYLQCCGRTTTPRERFCE